MHLQDIFRLLDRVQCVAVQCDCLWRLHVSVDRADHGYSLHCLPRVPEVWATDYLFQREFFDHLLFLVLLANSGSRLVSYFLQLRYT